MKLEQEVLTIDVGRRRAVGIGCSIARIRRCLCRCRASNILVKESCILGLDFRDGFCRCLHESRGSEAVEKQH